MINMHRQARRAARWIVAKAMGDELTQKGTAATDERTVAPGMPALARQAAAEGCVLLTNDGTLPLSPTSEVAVFGRCQLDWFFMGYGSGGSVHAPYTVNLMDALVAAGVSHNHALAEIYRTWCDDPQHAIEDGSWGHGPTHHPEMPVSAELARSAAQTASTAVVVIGRAAGESQDLPLAQGGYYLTNEELRLLSTVTAAFAHTVMVLNTGNVIDLSWTQAYGDRLSAVLLAWQGGMEAGAAVADVLYGKINPSGRLAATIACRYRAYPSSATFGKRTKVDYREGIFVGYRHFDAYAPSDVLFPFGHGLSYATFEQEFEVLERSDAGIVVRVRVTNAGSRAGRDVVQLWCCPPRGSMEKPVRTLVAFGKTTALEPGESEVMTLEVDLKTIASFDERTHSFVLEAGTYEFALGENSRPSHEQPHTTAPRESLVLDEPLVVERCTPLCTSSAELRERILAYLELQEAAERGEDASATDGGMSGRAGDASSEHLELETLIASLSDADLKALTCGEGFMNSKLGAPGNAGAFGGVTKSLREKGVSPIICADGPSGARLARHCSLVPCATALACTWDTGLVQELYALVGQEVRDAGVDVLLAPGMNIQRNPLCGRNFEYFSEDPLLTGHMAASVVRGLRGAGVEGCPKHFACNNQERRRNRSDSRVSERALREIYLRGFEICVREARPRLIMTSYNLVNGVWSHYNFDLVTIVLRGEWGFAGVVITDWWMRRAKSPEFPELRTNAYRIRAGVNVLMPGTPKGVRGIPRAELERTARHILALAAKPNQGDVSFG